MRWLVAVLALAGCSNNTYIVEGVVVDVNSSTQVVIDHKEIPGFMDAMTMPFEVSDPALLADVTRGDKVYARLVVENDRSYLEKLRVVGRGAVPDVVTGPGPVRPGQVLPTVAIPTHTGESWSIGADQGVPTAVAFLYTTCPLPEFCPMVTTRLQGLQEALEGTEARILAVTIDPERDTMDALGAYASKVGAVPATWRFGRLAEQKDLQALALRAALTVTEDDNGTDILHSLRLMVLAADGRLVERYDDNNWPLDRVVQQLRTGKPPAPPGSDGTLTPRSEESAG